MNTMESFFLSTSCFGCERLEGILEENIPTWQERIYDITGLKVVEEHGSDHINDNPPYFVRLEGGSLADYRVVDFTWRDARNDHIEREQAIRDIVENCPGYVKNARKCGKITLENYTEQ